MYHTLEAGVIERVAESIPQMGVGAFATEEERMKRTSANAQRAAGGGDTTTGGTTPRPVKADTKIGRNELVKITDGKEMKEMKYKKAERLLAEGQWRLVD